MHGEWGPSFEENCLMVRKIRNEVGGLAVALVAVFGAMGTGNAVAVDLDQLVAQRMEVNDESAKSQVRIDKISDDTDRLTAEYRVILQRIDALQVYNKQVSELIASQEEEMASLRRQIDDVELVGREVTPLMLGMLDALENFVELDVPFLPKERADRMAFLHDVMIRADVTDAERYRHIVEAYQIENEFGRTIEAYQADLELGGAVRTVDFLRVGRVAFLYQTLDGTETGRWDQKERQWVDAADSDSAVRLGLRMARKQTAPDLLKLPLPTAEAAQ
jgi:septal ring factor EnvC (AmiA/AmiB activator)